MLRRVIVWTAVLLWAAGIFKLSSIPSYHPTPPPFPYADKVVHFGLYFVLGALLCEGLSRTRRSRVVIVVAAIGIAALYGVSDEWHQIYVVGRDASVADWIADALGACTGATAVALVYRRRHGDRARLRRQDSDAR